MKQEKGPREQLPIPTSKFHLEDKVPLKEGGNDETDVNLSLMDMIREKKEKKRSGSIGGGLIVIT